MRWVSRCSTHPTHCVYTFATGEAEDKKWASGIVGAIASGLVGFLVGQGKK
ncbi:MAG: hypothetical protein WCS87_06200 [Methylococcaceae bacterium]